MYQIEIINDILPPEILQNIFRLIHKNNKIELVCKYWKELCEQKTIQAFREPCVCNLNYGLCKSVIHECICEFSRVYTINCKAEEHPCICYGKELDFEVCRGEEHLCICDISPYHSENCREEKDKHECICDIYWTTHCKVHI